MFYEKSLGKLWFCLFEELVLIIKDYSHFSTFFTCLIKWKLLCNAGNLEQTLLSILVKCLKLSPYNLHFIDIWKILVTWLGITIITAGLD